MADVAFREQFTDAVSAIISDQEAAGLDILTNGDYHLDADLAGRSWFSYPTQRLTGISDHELDSTNPMWSYPVGTWLNEIVGGWKYPKIVRQVRHDLGGPGGGGVEPRHRRLCGRQT
jgi:5-methyltetrahydropteroyltriglutamate--homocysteine methyltransferase